jgi:hypothetical protein
MSLAEPLPPGPALTGAALAAAAADDQTKRFGLATLRTPASASAEVDGP